MKEAIYAQVRWEEMIKSEQIASHFSFSSASSFLERREDRLRMLLDDFYYVSTFESMHYQHLDT